MSDLLLLITGFLIVSLPRIGELFGNYSITKLGYYCTPIGYGLGLTTQTISVYMTILISAHRFIGVCLPYKAPRVLNTKAVICAIVTVLAFSILFNVTRFFEVRVASTCFSEKLGSNLTELAQTALRKNADYQTVFFGWCYTIVMFILPFSGLIFMNTNVVLAVRRTRRLHEAISCADADDTAKRQELLKEISTSIMLIGVVVVFLACNSLGFIANVIEVAKIVDQGEKWYSEIVDFNNLLVAVNASINIFVYCLFSEKYRALLAYFLLCGWLREGDMLFTVLQS